MAIHLPTEIFGNVVVVHTPEELSSDHLPRLAEMLSTQDRCNVVVDLDGTETIDSSGLALLLDAQDALRGSGGDLRLSTSNATNRKILEITRLQERMELFETVLEAVKSFS